jgi:hypothetical protein
MPVSRPQFRPVPGTRPAAPVRCDEIPDDWKCTWTYRVVSCPAGENGTGFWELKYINAACLEHARLLAA